VTDPSGAVVGGASVLLRNPLSGLEQNAVTDSSGVFRFRNLPPNPYHLEVSAPGFAQYQQDVSVRTAVPINFKITLTVAGAANVVTVESSNPDMLENVAYAHSDVSRESLSKLPALSAGSGLSDAITFKSPGVVADSNGFFHPLGDHAQVSFSVDGQPISDQQSKLFSTQLPLNAIESMELITGAPDAEFGDKTSLVVNAVTRSGLGKGKPFGSIALQYGSFGTPSEEASLGWGNSRYGNFIVANALRSNRFLDTPEFTPLHAIGNNETFFDHFDYQANKSDTFHVNLFGARNWFQIPNTYDQPGQDQRQKVVTFNVAPSYQHTFSPALLLTVNTFFRQDQVQYYPSANLFADTPATLSQARRLSNFGTKTDIAYVHGIHNLKVGVQAMQTRIKENFNLGVTDPFFNPVCVDSSGNPQALPSVIDPGGCAALGFQPNPSLQPGLVPFDLTRGGSIFAFSGRARVNEFAFYAQDSLTFKHLTLNPGLRIDRYNGLSKATGVEPRFGASYLIKRTGSVLRAAYSRTFETPYNENLVVSSATGAGGLATNVFGAYASQPLQPGRRNQFNVGLQQSFGRYLMVDGDYFWKFTDNAFDFDTLFNTPVHFPISWRKSKIDGVSLRLNTTDIHGFMATTTMGHTRARFFGPEIGGLIFNSPVDASVFRIDHDQALQQTTNLRYQRPKNGPWVSFVWRYDSGLVAGAVRSLADALSLTAAQQAAIGFFCGSQSASLGNPITSCSSSNYGATRLVIPAAGTANADLNPPRIAPRNLFDLSVGTDHLFRFYSDRARAGIKLSVVNLTNKIALYNFLSTFSGTHFVTPRTLQAEFRISF
jgi:outer membrane cobalamin receptor